jgi:hypothetical protein
MILAVEDTLSEVVARKLLAVVRPDISVAVAIGNQGRGYLQNRARELNRVAAAVPVFLLADLDRPLPCPSDLISSWISGPPQRHFFCRVAVMEVESWVLADRARFADFLSVPEHRIPENTDEINFPKEFIVTLARRSRRKDIRDDLVPATGSTSPVGPAYNPRLASFVGGLWDPRVAAAASPSLARAVRRLGSAFGSI